MTSRRRSRGGRRGRAISQPYTQPDTSHVANITQFHQIHTGHTPMLSPYSQTCHTSTPSSHSQARHSSASSPNPLSIVVPTPPSHIMCAPSPSLSACPNVEAASLTPQNIQWGKNDIDGRIWIRSASGNTFYPDFPTRGVITTIFKKKFEGAWSSWRKVDDNTIKMWFDEFKANFKWLDNDKHNIKRSFDSRGSTALKNALFKVRNGEDKGDWIPLEMLQQLRAEWDSEGWQHKARKNKQNRLSKEGLNVRSERSIFARKHAKRMRVQMNKKSTCFELYERLHRPKGKLSESFNEQQGRIAEMYQTKIAERQFESQSDKSFSQHSTQHSDNVVYLDVVGDMNNKERIDSLGSQAHNILAAGSTFKSFTSDGVSEEQVSAMNAKIEALSARLQQSEDENLMLKQKVEGAADEDGRTPSIIDTYVNAGNSPGAYGNRSTDQYHKYKEDVQLTAKMGLNAYRCSISWPRLITNGKGPVNPKGLEYYNNLINEQINHGIQPDVTLYHFDLPQALEDEYEGWLRQKVVRDFTAYADLCFREFGDRVKYWTTMNEPTMFVPGGYDFGSLSPQRCSPPYGYKCSKGISSTEPYTAAHHILLAHASAATLYREMYQAKPHGFIGINIAHCGYFPLTNTSEDLIAAQRAKGFLIRW